MIAFAAVVLCFGGVSAWLIGGALVAPANRSVGPPPKGLPVESLILSGESDARLSGWYMPAPDATSTVILLHPVRADRRAMLGRAKLLHDAGHCSLLIDLQAHGESEGEQITMGHRESRNVDAAIRWVRKRHPQHRIGVVGWSLGGAAALLAAPSDVDAMVIESVYPTIREAVENRIEMRLGWMKRLLAPALLVQLQPRLGVSPSELCPLDCIPNVNCPILVACGDRDSHTPLEESLRMFRAAREPKQLVVFPGAHHEDLLRYEPDRYSREVASFLNRHLRAESVTSGDRSDAPAMADE